jgi:hypothetical protein
VTKEVRATAKKPLQGNGWMWGVEYIYKPIHSPLDD